MSIEPKIDQIGPNRPIWRPFEGWECNGLSNLFCGGSHTLTQIAPFACHNAPQVCHTWQLANLWVVMVVGGNIATSPTPPCGLPHACPTRVSWAIARDGKIGNKGVRLGQNRPQKWIPCEFLHHISGTHFFTTTPMPKSCAGCKLGRAD